MILNITKPEILTPAVFAGQISTQNTLILAMIDNINAFNRAAPKMPNNATSSAFVVLLYDTDEQGRPTNIRQLQKSHAITFDASSDISMASWRLAKTSTKGGSNTKPKPVPNAKNQVAKFTYMLSDRKGRTLDFYGRSFD